MDARFDVLDRSTATARLTATDYRSQLEEYARLRHPGTLNWLLESTEYQTWLQGHPQTLFCFGEPGTGKSVAASAIVQDLEERFCGDDTSGQQQTAGIAYFFFDSLRHEEQSYDNVVRCIVQQLAMSQAPLEESSEPPWRPWHDYKFTPSNGNVSGYLQNIMEGYLPAFAVLDALDECSETYRTALLSTLAKIQRVHGSLNILVTSQRDCVTSLEEQFENIVALEIRASEGDLFAYISDNIKETEDRDLALANMVQAANGRFLMAKLQLDLFSTHPIPHETQHGIDTDYAGIYENIMDRIASQDLPHARIAERSLLWLAFARRPLFASELQHALAIGAGQGFESDLTAVETIISSCCGLARLGQLNDAPYIQLWHHTARVYLRQHLQGTEYDVGRACITYLLNNSNGERYGLLDEFKEFMHSKPLYIYAAQYWGLHVQGSKAPLSDEVIRDFLADQTKWRGVLKAAEVSMQGQDCSLWSFYFLKFPKNMRAIHLAARAGAVNIVTALIAQDRSTDMAIVRDSRGRTVLMYAAKAGNMDMVEQLLLFNLSVDVNMRDYEGRTAISYAAEKSHDGVIARLLACGANASWMDFGGATPLWYATKNNHMTTVRILLDSGRLSDVNPVCKRGEDRDYTGDTPLSMALRKNYREIAELLVRADGIDPHVKLQTTSEGTTSPLEVAIQYEHEDIALALLEKYGAGNSRGSKPGANLAVCAASIGSTKLVQLLLEKYGADPNAIYSNENYALDGHTPLMAAADRGHAAVVRMLLDTAGIQPDLELDDEHSTAFSMAAKRGFRDVVKMLAADNRVNVNREDYAWNTALSLASQSGHEDVVEFLLTIPTVDPNHQNREGRTPLFEVIYGHGFPEPQRSGGVVQKLLADSRVNLYTQDRQGDTLLYYAIDNGRSNLAEAILEHPRTDLNQEDGATLLAAAAARRSNVDVVKMLLQPERFGDIINTTSYYKGEYHTPLSIAAEKRNEDVVDVLLSSPGIEPDKIDEWGTPLAAAVKGGSTAIVQRLLAIRGVDPNGGGENAPMTPLCAVSVSEEWISRDDIAKELLEANGIRPDAANCNGRTALSFAAEKNKLKLVDMFLAAGVDPDSRDDDGRTPLSWAIDPDETDTYGREEVIRRFLQIQTVDPNSEDAEGLTPLIRAIQRSDGNELVQLLLERDDLDVNRRGRNGRAPIEIAKKKAEIAIASMLRAKGALDKTAPTIKDPKKLKIDEESEIQEMAVKRRRRRRSSMTSDLFHPFESGGNRGKSVPDSFERSLHRKIRLPLGSQKGYPGLVEASGADLCSQCAEFDLDDIFSRRCTDYEGRIIASLGKVDETWETRNCPMCRLISAIRPRYLDEEKGADGNQQNLVAFSTTGTYLCNSVHELWLYFQHPWIDTMGLCVVASDSHSFSPFVPEYYLSKSIFTSGFIGRLGSNCPYQTQAITIPRLTDSGINLDIAKGWIKCCRKTHSTRCNPKKPAKIPHFHLIDCATRKISAPWIRIPPYVALSYVWGSSNQPTMKKKFNRRGIPRGKIDSDRAIEPVIEDAIYVTLQLGYRYLWVDQYCVVQEGNEEVKQVQLRSMNLVYSNSEIIIVAAAGQDSSFGLPGVRNNRKRSTQPCVRIKGHSLAVVPPDPAQHIRPSTWSTRGWTYQEGLLARRHLFFTEHEISYECSGLRGREAIQIPQQIEQQMDIYPHRLMQPSWIYGQKDKEASGDSIGLATILIEYTKRKLTHQKDELNAILGILRVFSEHKKTPVQHICGVIIMHEKDLIRRPPNPYTSVHETASSLSLADFASGLCWTLQRPTDRRDEFPSWSWAGWNGTIHKIRAEWTGIILAYGFDLDVSIVLADETTELPWSTCFNQLQNRDPEKDFHFSQKHTLKMTANVVEVQFWENEEPLREEDRFFGTVCIGNDVWKGSFSLTCAELLPGNGTIGLFEKSYLGLVLGHSYSQYNYINETYVLVVKEERPPKNCPHACWGRVGLLKLEQFTPDRSTLERRIIWLV